MEGDFINLKWMKKVEDFRSHWFFVDILEELELFLITGIPPVKLTTWASEALPEEALRTLHPRIRDLWRMILSASSSSSGSLLLVRKALSSRI
jgi:hypothetical protein